MVVLFDWKKALGRAKSDGLLKSHAADYRLHFWPEIYRARFFFEN
jgi:hypothetical protein